MVKDINKLLDQAAIYNSKIFHAEVEQKRNHERHEYFEDNIQKLFNKMTILETEKVDKTNAFDKEQDLLESFSRLKTSIDQKENKLRTLERFIDRYVPIRI